MESELFGHERGAFTGANVRRIGRFEQAKGGTIFLDEIGDMTGAAQVKLLRVIQERYIQRVGGNDRIPIHARLLSATHRDLRLGIKENVFRQDLFYRLAGFVLKVPSVRERVEDIPDLVNFFLHNFPLESCVEKPSIQARAVEFLKRQVWQGNLRELQNVIGHALCLAGQHPISLTDVEQACAATHASVTVTGIGGGHITELFLKAEQGEIKNLHAKLIEETERELFTLAFDSAKGNQTQIARWLGINRKTVREKLSQLGIH
jgi:two-component system, NtrC family, nitrogen regulation response regulator GlnG